MNVASPTVKMNHKLVTVRGHRIHVAIRHGDKSQLPLLLMNGIGANLNAFKPFIAALDSAFEVICFDVPGVGNSPTPIFPYRFSGLASLVAMVLDELGYDQVNVLGISWGGALAQQFAWQEGAKCHRLILVSTATGALMVPGHPNALRHLVTPRRYYDSKYLSQIGGEIYGGVIRAHPENLAPFTNGLGPFRNRRGYFYQLLAGVGWTSLPWLPFLRQPTLILSGNDDPLVPVINARIMARLIPKAKLHIFDDGHLGLLTQAHTLTPVIMRFLGEALVKDC